MKKYKGGYLFPLFALFVIFSDELFFSFVSVIGAELESGMKSREAIVIAAISFTLIFIDVLKNRFSVRNYKQFVALFFILVLYFITGRLYPHTDIYDRYWAAFLTYGALCIPSCYIGIRLAKGNYNKQIMDLLPYVVVIVSVVVGSAVVLKSMTGLLLSKEEDAFNYQTSSYYMASCFSYCMLFIFFKDKKKHAFYDTIISIILFVALFICAIGTVLGGGRGAFVYLVLIAVYLIYRIMKSKGSGMKLKNVFLLLISSAALVFLATRFNILESSGATRLIERLGTINEGEARFDSWNDAMKVFSDSPFWGQGIGSIWWTVGFYSHNMLADLLAEMGLVGATIILYVLANILIRQIKLSYNNKFDMFMLLVLLGTLVHDAFSGYWISSPKLFLLFGYIYGVGRPQMHKTIGQ